MRGMEGIVDQLHRSLEGDSWQGASIRDVLEGVTVTEAAAHPAPGAHSMRDRDPQAWHTATRGV